MIRRVYRLLLIVYGNLPRPARRLVVRTIAPTYTVGAMCFVEREDGALLLVQQIYRKKWGVPGGLLKRGEQPEDAAKREILEEVGIGIVLVGEPAVVVAADPQRVDIVFRARVAPGVRADEARPVSPEIDAARWFPRDELPELQVETSGALVALARAQRQGLTPSSDRR